VRAAVLLLCLAACSDAGPMASALTGGNPQQGRVALRAHGCVACHRIPGVRGAEATVAPPLDRMARRLYIAGVLPNTAENLVHWVRHPQRVVPGNAMPELGISDGDARDMAAYLMTLR
jgi:cytochrome c